MNLEHHWDYILDIAAQRLRNNRTAHHIARYGDELEIMGAAGELAARIFLGTSLEMGVHFDGGMDIQYGTKRVDVKATKLTPGVAFRFLQWPIWKDVKSDIILMTVVNVPTMHAMVIGYATNDDVANAIANMAREIPCVEIPFVNLRPAWELVADKELNTCSMAGQTRLAAQKYVEFQIRR